MGLIFLRDVDVASTIDVEIDTDDILPCVSDDDLMEELERRDLLELAERPDIDKFLKYFDDVLFNFLPHEIEQIDEILKFHKNRLGLK